MHVRWTWGAAGILLTLILVGCGGSTGSGATIGGSTTTNTNTPVTGASASASGSDAAITAINPAATTTATSNGDATAEATAENVLTISISNDPDKPLYSQGVMSAPAGTSFVVSYNNAGPNQHNWVLVQPGKEQAVADAAAARGGNPEGIDGVIAWSEITSDKTVTINVPTLDRGAYPYICTVPGHYQQGHKGALNVR